MKKLVISALILSLLLNLFLAYAARDSIRMKIASFFHSETSFSDVKEDSSKILAKTRNKPVVTHSAFGNVDFLEIDSLSSESNQLPDSLFISAGKYKCYENTYNLKAAGVYRFIYPGIGNEQRIVHNGDIDTLLSSIAWVVTHGNSDTSLNNKLLLQKATQSKIFTTCGKVSRLANSILDKFEIKSRIVSGVTTDE